VRLQRQTLRAILCKDQRTIKVLRNGMSQNMLIFTSYVTYRILNSNIDMKIEEEKSCDVKVSDIYFTEFGAALTTVLPVVFKYCYKYCYSDSRKF
jgi:hypothetical protein